MDENRIQTVFQQYGEAFRKDLIQVLQLLTGIDYSICPCCQTGRMKRYNPLE